MSDTNLDLWDRFADIDPAFTKPITGKPYNGTSPNPHYVIRCLTEMFGPVGQGFGWEVTAEGFQPLGDEVLHWCRIRFWHGDGKGFDAYGQTKALMKTRKGDMLSDEDAPKKSLTDAITKAAAQIGVASNIFLGRWDDSRYVERVNAEFRDAEKPEPTSANKRDWLKENIDKAPDADTLDHWLNDPKREALIQSLDAPHKAEINKLIKDKRASFEPVDMPPGFDGPGSRGAQYQ